MQYTLFHAKDVDPTTNHADGAGNGLRQMIPSAPRQ